MLHPAVLRSEDEEDVGETLDVVQEGDEAGEGGVRVRGHGVVGVGVVGARRVPGRLHGALAPQQGAWHLAAPPSCLTSVFWTCVGVLRRCCRRCRRCWWRCSLLGPHLVADLPVLAPDPGPHADAGHGRHRAHGGLHLKHEVRGQERL